MLAILLGINIAGITWAKNKETVPGNGFLQISDGTI